MKQLLLGALLLVAATAQAQTDYPRNFTDTQVSNKSDRKITNIRLTGSVSGEANVTPQQSGTNYMYRDMLSTVVSVAAGETMDVEVSYNANWMNAFIYLDRGNDGQFDVTTPTQEAPTPDCDLMAYSYIEVNNSERGFNMSGATVTGGNRSTTATPAFTIPADLAPGMYRMRVKIDWGSADPAGRIDAANSIINNGGQIVDFLLNVRGTTCTLATVAEHGTVTAPDAVAFGQPITVTLTADQGYVPASVTVRYGYNLDGEQYLHSNPQWHQITLPRTAIAADGSIVLPAAYAIADMHVTGSFITLAEADDKGDYPCNFDKQELMVAQDDRIFRTITLANAEATCTINGVHTTAPLPVYTDATSQTAVFKAGETITPTCSSKDTSWMFGYLYIDYNDNGYFDIAEAELVSQSTDGATGYANMPAFTLPAWLQDGEYRARFKTDWDSNDPGGRYGEAYTTNLINDNRGQIIDFTLRIDNSLRPARLREETEHCVLYMPDGATQLPTTVRGLESITFCVKPMTDYVLDGTLDVVSEEGTVSFDQIPDDGILTASIGGNTLIRAHFKQGPNATWHCIFNDEFNADGHTWDDDKWRTRELSPGVTWARFNSQLKTDSVAVQNNGYLSLTTKTTGTNTMVTGNLNTQGRCDFTYGRVEARCLVYPWTGNFPAFWMMPSGNKPNYNGNGYWGGWPNSGEIDIMEQINWENKAYQTIHTYYANTLGQTHQKAASCWVDMYDKWHIYAVEWDKEQLRWYVDGRHVHTYDRIPAKDNDTDRQWPYDRPFYVIINQSVGNGSWAANADFGHQYRMDVDYVRVYQVCEPDAVQAATATQAVQVNSGKGRIVVTAPTPTAIVVADLEGRTRFAGTVSGTQSIALPAGIYTIAGRKVVVQKRQRRHLPPLLLTFNAVEDKFNGVVFNLIRVEYIFNAVESMACRYAARGHACPQGAA